MEKKKISVAIVTNIIPTYREGFYDRIFMRDELDVTVYCQKKIYGMNLVSIHKKYGEKIKIIKCIAAKREKIAWQFLPFLKIIKQYDVVFVNGNPRVLSDLFIATTLRLLGKNIVLWTMAHSVRANSITEDIRLYWTRMFKYIFVYTDGEVEYLRKKGFKLNDIIGMNNGLDQKKIERISKDWTEFRIQEWKKQNNIEDRLIILSCARLEKKNRFDLFAHAMPLIKNKYPNVLWCIIGDGEEKDYLMQIINDVGIERNIRFVGALYDESDLAPYFISSKIFVHPAAIGLSLLHAFGYGLPVVTHGESEYQNPEYAAFESFKTGRNYIYGDYKSLASVVVELMTDEKQRADMKKYNLSLAENKYNVDVMVNRFVSMTYKVNS